MCYIWRRKDGTCLDCPYPMCYLETNLSAQDFQVACVQHDYVMGLSRADVLARYHRGLSWFFSRVKPDSLRGSRTRKLGGFTP